ncbi:MAG: Methanol dehydrogenase activator [Candidatus Dichloromethanomonas elyunquensis]|nr:MAG: Methanol dehydrogenase activator [Candidatus Dichloromethanomonas elyunquensis]
MSEIKFEEKCLSSQLIHNGKIIKVLKDTVSLPNGRTATREIVRHPGAVGIVALHERKVLMVKQYRYALGQETLEIPAGKIDPGEKPEICAIRELREETGYEGVMSFLGVFHISPGFADEKIFLYLAEDLRWAPLQADEDEFIGLTMIPWEEAVKMANQGKIMDAKTALGILLTAGKI